jgi:hypothetical protein
LSFAQAINYSVVCHNIWWNSLIHHLKKQVVSFVPLTLGKPLMTVLYDTTSGGKLLPWPSAIMWRSSSASQLSFHCRNPWEVYCMILHSASSQAQAFVWSKRPWPHPPSLRHRDLWAVDWWLLRHSPSSPT